jgi:hypothetical protein
VTTATREFTHGDWQGFCGAEPWTETDKVRERQPLIREMDAWCVVIADKNGVELTYFTEDGWRSNSLRLEGVVFSTQAGAKLFLDALPDLTSVEAAMDLGFVEY